MPRAMILNQAQFCPLPPSRPLAISGDIFGYHSWDGRWGLLASSEWKPEMLTNILPYIAQPLTTKNYPARNFSSTVVEKLWHGENKWSQGDKSGSIYVNWGMWYVWPGWRWQQWLGMDRINLRNISKEDSWRLIFFVTSLFHNIFIESSEGIEITQAKV